MATNTTGSQESTDRPQDYCERAVLAVARPFANRHGVTVAASALRNAARVLEGRAEPPARAGGRR